LLENSYHLPIEDILDDVLGAFTQHQTLIVTAPPGAGKSTLLPLKLIGQPWLGNQKIVMLEPRRLAAKTIALRMAELNNDEV
jgi:ATP-dependent helicase HrpB